MSPGLVIFDCDGVLVDTEPESNRVFADALCELGLAVTYESVCHDFVGLSMESCVAEVERRLGRAVPEGFAAEVQRRTFERFRRVGVAPVEGVAEALDALPHPSCVASSGEIEKMRLTLGLAGLLGRFEGALFSATQVEHGKPAPDLFLLAADAMGAAPSTCVVVEDSEPGVRAGRAAGMRVLGYAGGGGGDRLARAGARVFDDMRALPGLLDCRPAGARGGDG